MRALHLDMDRARVAAIHRQLVDGGTLLRTTQRELCSIALRALAQLAEREREPVGPGGVQCVGAPVGAER